MTVPPAPIPGPPPGGARPGPPPGYPLPPVPGPTPGPDAAGPGAEGGPDTTGHPAVDAVLRSLDNATQLPPAEQIAAYEAAHQVLQETLASIDR
ncbi:hypothetical protein [Krasilnikovia sp. M28-CT-15]|uniref:hypothetical protein n=1 Tax=Krasilnikovia sp. M28-CT-15 TaxID=3373540 RepID=UPI0038760C86